MNKLAIGILSLRRYTCLEMCLQAMQRNTDLDLADFLFFQDGAVNPYSGIRYARDDEVKASLAMFIQSDFPNKTIIDFGKNVGGHLGFYHMITEGFGRGYETVVVLPNDAIVGKHFIKTILVLTEQFGHDEKAGVFEPKGWDHTKAEVTYANMLALENKVAYGMPLLWGTRLVHGAWRWCWEVVRERLDCYYERARHYDSNQLQMCSDYRRPKELLPIVTDIWETCGTTLGGEHFLTVAARLYGMRGIHTLAPRASHMGTKPYSVDLDTVWPRHCLDNQQLWDFGGGVDFYEVVPDDWGPLGFGENLGCRR